MVMKNILFCLTALSILMIAAGDAVAGSSKYNRKDWPHWIDADRDCQNTRAEILIHDSVGPVKFKRNKGCNVSWGKWIGPYTGKTFTKASDIDIDHIVPLSHAHKTGGANWSRFSAYSDIRAMGRLNLPDRGES